MIAAAPPTMPTAAPAASPASMVPVDRPGKKVVAVNASDNSTRDHTMIHATMFCRKVFTHGPSTARSLQSKTRNTVAEGSRTPASACTPWVTRPRMWSGLNATAADTARSSGVAAVEQWGLADLPMQ